MGMEVSEFRKPTFGDFGRSPRVVGVVSTWIHTSRAAQKDALTLNDMKLWNGILQTHEEHSWVCLGYCTNHQTSTG